MEGLLGEIRALVKRLATMLGGLRSAGEAAPRCGPRAPSLRSARSLPRVPGTIAGQQRGMEMAEALAAAVERLRARALSAPPLPEDPGEPAAAEPHGPRRCRRPGGAAAAPPRAGAAASGRRGGVAWRPERPRPIRPAREATRKAYLVVPQAQAPAPQRETPPPLPEAPRRPSPPRRRRAPSPRHKHSQSLLRRIRNRRKERRGG